MTCFSHSWGSEHAYSDGPPIAAVAVAVDVAVAAATAAVRDHEAKLVMVTARVR